MNKLLLVLLLACAGIVPAAAQTPDTGQATQPAAGASDATAGALTEGEIRKVDREAGTITLKHGDIRNLDMPGMTMVFKVRDPALLDKVKAGDRVRFRAEAVNGAIAVTRIEKGQ